MKPANGLMKWNETYTLADIVFDGTMIDDYLFRCNFPVFGQSTTISKDLPFECNRYRT
jgi:hypothetical protein